VIVLEPDLTWTGNRFEPGLRVAVDENGRIAALTPPDAGPPGLETTHRLRGRALLPGFVNAHSHAFQRGLRGQGERFSSGAGSFWTWREAMYGLVDGLGAPELRDLARGAFREMIAAGITTVGEFHYLHHTKGTFDWELDEAILTAAREVGIRLVLLEVFYRTGGIGRPLTGAQVRFDARSVAEYWRRMDALERRLDPSRQSLGAAPHSIRAASLEEIVQVCAEARARGLVVHMHVGETARETTDCRAAYGVEPLELLTSRLTLDRGITGVHGTHCPPPALDAFFQLGANLCLCPLTEANLGDGIPRLHRVPPGQLAVGTDSNARISIVEEMRWAEYGQRLAHQRRGALTDSTGEVARTVFLAATCGGARSLGVEAGAIEPGLWADFIELDLGSRELEGWTAGTLLESFVFGASERSIAGAWIAGRTVSLTNSPS
jgi:formimidoylglutamate deiminase